MRVMQWALALLLAAVCNLAIWYWPNRPQPISAPVATAPVQSVSFAPFRRGQSPLSKVYPSQAEIEQDIAALAGRVQGLRTYTSLEGLQAVPELARRHGLTVAMGAWLTSSKEVKGRRINEAEVASLIDLANRHPDTISRVIVGNEVLLRNDLKPEELAAFIRRVRQSVKQPVTYADVWEFWLRNPSLAAEVDFITVHFLPYWEDQPVGVEEAMAHILAVHAKVAKAFPGKPILIGEVGWPSHGRSREGARPGRWMQAEFVNAFRRLAAEHRLDYNIVEAFDQPWKVALEGTVGGNWGLFDVDRQAKFPPAGPVVEHPDWLVPPLGAVALAPLLLLLGLRGRRPKDAYGVFALALLAQFCAAVLAAAFWLGHQHAYDLLRILSASLHFILQFSLSLLLVRRSAEGLSGSAAMPADEGRRGIRASLADFSSNWALFLPLGRAAVSPTKLQRFAAMRTTWMIEWLGLAFLLLALYQTFMLAFFGRYRDFPMEQFAVAAFGLPLAAILVGARNGAILHRLGAALLPPGGNARGVPSDRVETILLLLLFGLLAVLVFRERPWNFEAMAWTASALGTALPLAARKWAASPVSGAKRCEAI